MENNDSLYSLSLPSLQTHRGGYVATYSALTTLSLPSLQSVSGGVVVYQCNALTTLSLPSLQSVSDGFVANGCSALTSLSLPSLQSVSGGYVASQCNALTTLSLPSLQTIDNNGSTGAIQWCSNLMSLSVPQLRTMRSGWFINGGKIEEINLPLLKTYTGGILVASGYPIQHFYMPSILTMTTGQVDYSAADVGEYHYHFGSQIFEEVSNTIAIRRGSPSSPTHIHIEPGFRVNLNLSSLTGVPADDIRAIAANLGDCTALGVSLTWTLNAAQKAMLTDEEKASVTARGWNIA